MMRALWLILLAIRMMVKGVVMLIFGVIGILAALMTLCGFMLTGIFSLGWLLSAHTKHQKEVCIEWLQISIPMMLIGLLIIGLACGLDRLLRKQPPAPSR